MIEKWKASVLEAAKRHMRAGESSGSSQKSTLSKLSSSLQYLLVEVTVISLGLDENVVGVEANQKELEGDFESTREQYLKMRDENEVLYKQNEELAERSGAAQVRNDDYLAKLWLKEKEVRL
ncbi:hypothetical protein ES288_D04G026900v1 [Gossypium darwinii]|uniref:Uncharacterized protein n=2 Tax=Gossypium TaxID=3633 RepID=A0A5D2L8X4_GOSTO|nr:hypothetical protein ES288_D04G026900v1 [Gossypium darwinii]TYH75579.1 hypothetical protein ES332_D04G028500v1 [Gossypium tomentosum]